MADPVREVGDIFQVPDGAYVRVVANKRDHLGGLCRGCYWMPEDAGCSNSRFDTIGRCGDPARRALTGSCARTHGDSRGFIKFVKVEFDKNRE